MPRATKDSRIASNATGALVSGNCSEFEVKLLKVIRDSCGNVSAGWLAGKMWPDAKGKWFGARSGRWQRMGAILQRLHNRNLLWREVTEHNQKLWTISTEGKRVADTPNDQSLRLADASQSATKKEKP